MATDLVLHNQGKPDAFGYQAAFVKVAKDGAEETAYSITQFASEINVYESLFAKSMQCSVGIFDGAGLMETIALQPGDYIDITLFAGEDDENKLVKRFVILNIGNVQRAVNSQAKTYTVSGLTLPAFLNKKNTLYRAYKTNLGDVVRRICQEDLAISAEKLEVEPTVGDTQLVLTGKTPFQGISQIMQHAISRDGGVSKSLYFFYEDRDGFRFKTLSKIIADAVAHKYVVSIDKNPEGTEADLGKIQYFAQLKAGSQSERMAAGMYENEVVEFDPIARRVTARKFNFAEKGQELLELGANVVADVANNVEPWITGDAAGKVRGLSNLVKFRVNDEAYEGQVNGLGEKYGAMVAQKAMFNQIIYAVQIFGNPTIKVGDVLDVTAPALAMQGKAPELDHSLNGKFLVGDVRHRIVNGEQFVTILNIFKDGVEAEYKRAEEK